MNPSTYSLSASVLQEMIDADYQKNYHRFETIYDTHVKGISPADQAQKIQDEFMNNMSAPLKKMQIEYLTKIT